MTALTRWVVRLHKWLALIVGLQIFLWVMGGFGMALMPIEQVRGEHTIAETAPAEIDLAGVLALSEAAERAGLVGVVSSAQLSQWHAGPVYRFATEAGPVLVDAETGERLSPLDEATARAVALAGYAGDAPISAVEYFPEPAGEYRRPNPSWRVSFDDGEGTRLYVNAETGVIDARRNDMWRLFDFLWMLHIMDYEEREDFNHPLIITAAGLALSVVLAGFVLLFVRMRRTVLVAMKRRASNRHNP